MEAEKRKFDGLDAENASSAEEQAGKKPTLDLRNEALMGSVEDKSVPTAVTLEIGPVTVSMACPHKKVRDVIGKKGSIIKEIIRVSGCKVKVDQNFPDNQPKQLILTGNPQAIATALTLIQQVIEFGPSTVLAQTENPPAEHTEYVPPVAKAFVAASHNNIDQFNTSMGDAREQMPFINVEDSTVPASRVGSLIGVKGRNVIEILRRTGCRVQVLQDDVTDGSDRRVQYDGTQLQIALAKQLVSKILNDGKGVLNNIDDGSSVVQLPPYVNYSYTVTTAPTGMMTKMVNIVPDKVKMVIGSKGSSINEIMNRSGAKVIVDQIPGQYHKMVYTGSHVQTELARFLVDQIVLKGMTGQNLLRSTEQVVIQEISIFQSSVMRLLGAPNPGTMSLVDIQAQVEVKITIDTTPVMSTVPGPSGSPEPTNKMCVMGLASRVQAAIALVCQYAGNTSAPQAGMPSAAMMQQQQQQQYHSAMPAFAHTPAQWNPGHR
jgi:predicted PilT family ATPase